MKLVQLKELTFQLQLQIYGTVPRDAYLCHLWCLRRFLEIPWYPPQSCESLSCYHGACLATSYSGSFSNGNLFPCWEGQAWLLPWVSDPAICRYIRWSLESQEQKRQGGFSGVFRARIHNSHHTLVTMANVKTSSWTHTPVWVLEFTALGWAREPSVVLFNAISEGMSCDNCPPVITCFNCVINWESLEVEPEVRNKLPPFAFLFSLSDRISSIRRLLKIRRFQYILKSNDLQAYSWTKLALEIQRLISLASGFKHNPAFLDVAESGGIYSLLPD